MPAKTVSQIKSQFSGERCRLGRNWQLRLPEPKSDYSLQPEIAPRKAARGANSIASLIPSKYWAQETVPVSSVPPRWKQLHANAKYCHRLRQNNYAEEWRRERWRREYLKCLFAITLTVKVSWIATPEILLIFAGQSLVSRKYFYRATIDQITPTWEIKFFINS